MSFFPQKTIIVKVRGIALTFDTISKKDFSRLKYYGKVTEEIARENPEIIESASDEITQLLASKIIVKDDEKAPTAEDLNELTNDEINDIIAKVSGSSESIKNSMKK